MLIRPAAADEFEAVQGFYWQLIDDMQGLQHHPKWQKGVYPADDELKKALAGGEMYLGTEDERIVAAMRVNHAVTEGYEAGRWSIDAAPEEVTVIHMLGVAVSEQQRGLAGQMVRFAIDRALHEGQKTVRLDVLHGNLPAYRLYDSMGFVPVGDVALFYEDTGLTDFTLYEYNL